MILTGWGTFVPVSAAVLLWHGSALESTCGEHAEKVPFSPLPALGWGQEQPEFACCILLEVAR